MKASFIAAFIICLVGYVVHTFGHLSEHSENKLRSSRIFEMFMMIIVFSGWFGWIYMIYSDPAKINLPGYIILPIGSILTVLGIGIFVSARLIRKGFREEDKLITTGVYSLFRYPLYIGVILLHVGIPIVFNSLLTLLSSVIWIAIIIIWMKIDETTLGRIYGKEYEEYKRRTFF